MVIQDIDDLHRAARQFHGQPIAIRRPDGWASIGEIIRSVGFTTTPGRDGQTMVLTTNFDMHYDIPPGTEIEEYVEDLEPARP